MMGECLGSCDFASNGLFDIEDKMFFIMGEDLPNKDAPSVV
jgi:hypothetical protein